MSAELERELERAGHAREGELDVAERKRHGVVHTPPAIARFVARSVDAALRELGRAGLSDPDVALVDPACGPGVFLAASMSVAAAGRPRVALGLDRDAHAIERARVLLAPPATHAGWPLRLAVADTLSSLDVLTPTELRGTTLAILGNPPWAGRSASRGVALSDRLLDDFRRDADGLPLNERKIGVLSDAYVRFWRWSCELARGAEGGAVVALVTNASFLDGPVHRGMRAALSRWFARVDIVDLGGSALIARSGARDENVFGVRPSVALTLAVRPAGFEGRARVRHAALRGSREAKLATLEDARSMDALALRELPAPAAWVPAPAIDPRYASWPSLPELMPFHREGLQSNRDAFCVDADRDALMARLRAFAAGEPGPWPGRVDVPSAHYDPERARAALRACEPDAHVVRVAYRPLDERWMAVVPALCHRPRPDLLSAMRLSSSALLTVRKDRGERAWTHFGLARHPPDNCYLSARSSCRTRAFPTHGPDGAPNVEPTTLARWARALDVLPAPEDLVRYVLGVLASARYRACFDAALRADYPRLPPPPSTEAWHAIVASGRTLERAFLGLASGHEPFVVGHHTVVGGGELARGAGLADAAFAAYIDV